MRSRAARAIAAVVSLALLAGCSMLGARPVVEPDEAFGVVEVYGVTPDGELVPDADVRAAAAWAVFSTIATPEYVGEKIYGFRVAHAPDSDTAAYVNGYLTGEWYLTVDLSNIDDLAEFRETLVHEYAHVFSLDLDQMAQGQSSCATVRSHYGCAFPDSWLASFDAEFWRAYGADAPEPDDTDAEAAEALFRAHEGEFVSEYAATNVTEDFAESFARFVFDPPPSRDDVAYEKLKFFWGIPDMVEKRERIRLGLRL